MPRLLYSGNIAQLLCCISGVMAVSKLLEMGHVAQYRAVLTQPDVHAIAEHDPDLARVSDYGLVSPFPGPIH